MCFCFSVEEEKTSRARQNRDMEVFFHPFKSILTWIIHKHKFSSVLYNITNCSMKSSLVQNFIQ